MSRWLKIGIPVVLLTVGAVICVVRWQAWFGMPDKPEWRGETLTYTFPTFRDDSVHGFVRTAAGWGLTEKRHLLQLSNDEGGLLRNLFGCEKTTFLRRYITQISLLLTNTNPRKELL